MAIEFTLVLDATMSSWEIAGWMASHCRLRIDRMTELVSLDGEGIVYIILKQSELGQEIVKERFGIESNQKLIMQIDKFDGFDAGIANVMRVCVAFLSSFKQDLVLLYNHERGLVLRKDGRLFVDTREACWPDEWTNQLLASGLDFVEQDLPLM